MNDLSSLSFDAPSICWTLEYTLVISSLNSAILLSGKSFSDDKNKAETLLQDFSLFCYFACCKKNSSNMSKSGIVPKSV